MLKLIAMFLMLIDHAALVFLPVTNPLYILCRLVGRLAMPIFAYKIASGFIYTSNLDKYIKRVGLMTLCAQIPFIWMITGATFQELFTLSFLTTLISHWNVGLTFVCALLILKFYKELSECIARYPSFNIIYIALLGLVAFVADYGLYGVMMVMTFYMFIAYKLTYTKCTLLLALCTLLSYLSPLSLGQFDGFLLQLPCLFSLILIKIIPDSKFPLGRIIWYSFYPLHMLILAFLSSLIF
ncbi:MAG: TraX family protein [Cellulosilyticaceae bacterium]